MSLLTKVIVCLAWVSSVAVGFGYAWKYEATQGASASTKDWPSQTQLTLDSTRTTIVLFAHPNCPCTLVSVNQLAELLSGKADRYQLQVVVVQAPGLPKDLQNSTVAKAARSIANTALITDPAGKEAKLFGAATSGQVFAFGPDGKERFCGGVTSARGHYGPNDGIDAIEAILSEKSPTVGASPVYGCSLLGMSL
jgi:hypothetical protein